MNVKLEVLIMIGKILAGALVLAKAYFMHSPNGSKLDKALVWVIAAMQEHQLRGIYDLATDPSQRRAAAIKLVMDSTKTLPIKLDEQSAGSLVDYIVNEWPHIEALFGKLQNDGT